MEKGTDFTGVAVVYFCHDGNDKFVMGLRNKNCRDEHDKWDIGGGAAEFGQSVEDALRKEILEEYCTDVLKSEFIGFRDVHREHNGRKTHWITLDFKCLVDPSKVANGEPHKFDEVKWFTLDSLLLASELHSNLPYFIEKYRDKL